LRSLAASTPLMYDGFMKERYSEVAKQIFSIVAVTGVVVVVAAAPGVILAAKLFEQNGQDFPKKYEKKRVARSLRGLQNKKSIQIKEKNGKFEIRLTKKGREQFREIQVRNIKIVKPLLWDKRWRIVIFDIPDNSHKYAREALRRVLKKWEFYQLQKSVWVCPWSCEKEIQAIAELYDVLQYVNIVVAEKVLDDISLRKHFKL
jgi:DNA-binding transcriptional regulator PaaX